jgi:hypothetical protein
MQHATTTDTGGSVVLRLNLAQHPNWRAAAYGPGPYMRGKVFRSLERTKPDPKKMGFPDQCHNCSQPGMQLFRTAGSLELRPNRLAVCEELNIASHESWPSASPRSNIAITCEPGLSGPHAEAGPLAENNRKNDARIVARRRLSHWSAADLGASNSV